MLASKLRLNDDVLDVASRAQLSNELLLDDEAARAYHTGSCTVDNHHDLVCVLLLRKHLVVLALEVSQGDLANHRELGESLEEPIVVVFDFEAAKFEIWA